MPPALQRLAVADSGRAAPHLRVHGWCPEDPLRAGEDRGREQIIPEPDGGPRHRVCGRRGSEAGSTRPERAHHVTSLYTREPTATERVSSGIKRKASSVPTA